MTTVQIDMSKLSPEHQAMINGYLNSGNPPLTATMPHAAPPKGVDPTAAFVVQSIGDAVAAVVGAVVKTQPMQVEHTISKGGKKKKGKLAEVAESADGYIDSLGEAISDAPFIAVGLTAAGTTGLWAAGGRGMLGEGMKKLTSSVIMGK